MVEASPAGTVCFMSRTELCIHLKRGADARLKLSGIRLLQVPFPFKKQTAGKIRFIYSLKKPINNSENSPFSRPLPRLRAI